MVLLIDNYDSFSYNLYQVIGEVKDDIKVVRNDEVTLEDIRNMKPSHIIISPGPGRPKDAGICEDVILHIGKEIPILGVCLGHQAICEVYGATVGYAKKLMHGKQSLISINNQVDLFQGMEKEIQVARYHSLAADSKTIPEELIVIGETKDQEVMAVKHREYPVYGVQFHPESILTPHGKQIIQNFLSL